VPKNKKNSNKKRRQLNPKTMLTCLVLMLVFIAELLFYTWCRVQCTQIKYDIAELIKQNQQLSAMQDNLKLELAHLKKPQRIAKIARDQLGLISPSAKQIIIIP
jgi:cell division protein FtsL